ncbi:MAG: maleylpyruvate isomerase N-terminal domain-containing protein, partial [Acidimicrobiia bacterium]|nr:maleylpyruvate isomerase N-terminal domain-containing protein [Acidimicrobiia bacterium]
AAYKAGQQRVTTFLEGRDTDVLVPACPAWTAADVVRHLAGVTADTINGVFDGLASDEWTDAQVSARRDMTFEAVLDEWSSNIDAASELLARIDESNVPAEFDTAFGRVPVSIVPSVAV